MLFKPTKGLDVRPEEYTGPVGHMVTFSIPVGELSSDGLRTAANYLMKREDRTAYKHRELARTIDMGDEFEKFLETQALHRLLSRERFEYSVVVDNPDRDVAVAKATSYRDYKFPDQGNEFERHSWSISVRKFKSPQHYGWTQDFKRDPVRYALDNLV